MKDVNEIVTRRASDSLGSHATPACIPQLGSDVHQNATEPVFAGPIAAIPPIGIVGSMLHKERVARRQQAIGESAVLLEFRAHRVEHDLVFDHVPVGANEVAGVSSHSRCLRRRTRQPNFLLMLRPRELLRLIEVL
jgi:hypothetical protein